MTGTMNRPPSPPRQNPSQRARQPKRGSGVRRPRTRKDTYLHRGVVALTIFVTLITVAVGVFWWRQNNLWNRIEKVAFSDGTLRQGEAVPPGEPLNFLLVGSDSRADGDPVDQTGGSNVSGQRSDVMLIIRIDPKDNQAAFLSVPRDLLVTINDTQRQQRINTAFNSSPDNLIKTIDDQLGIPIDHFMQIDFTGFAAVVDALGGVQVNFAYPAIDEYSGLDIKNAGCQRLDGEQALSFVRSRHFRYFVDGKESEDPSGDIGRIERQQYLIKQIVKQATAQGATNPVKADQLLSSVVGYLKLDDSLTKGGMLDLVRQLKNIGVDNLTSFQLPTKNGSATLGGQRASILNLVQPDADQTIAEFLSIGAAQPVTGTGTGTGAPTSAPSTQTTVAPSAAQGVTAQVLNGTTAGGLASSGRDKLKAAGMNVTRLANAANTKYTTTEIHYGTGKAAQASAAAQVLGVTPKMVEDKTVTSTDLVVILGTDFVSALKTGTAGRSVNLGAQAQTTTTVATPTTEPPKMPKGISADACG